MFYVLAAKQINYLITIGVARARMNINSFMCGKRRTFIKTTIHFFSPLATVCV
jgi:hypothetical protein